MSTIGTALQADQLVLTNGRDFRWKFSRTWSTACRPTSRPANST